MSTRGQQAARGCTGRCRSSSRQKRPAAAAAAAGKQASRNRASERAASKQASAHCCTPWGRRSAPQLCPQQAAARTRGGSQSCKAGAGGQGLGGRVGGVGACMGREGRRAPRRFASSRPPAHNAHPTPAAQATHLIRHSDRQPHPPPSPPPHPPPHPTHPPTPHAPT